MKIRISKNELYKKLKTVGKIVQPSKTLAVSETFKFDVMEETFSVTGTDLSGRITAKNISCEKDPGNITFIVDAKLLLSAFAELPEQPIELEVNEKSMRVRYAGGQFDIPLVNGVFPEIHTSENYYSIHIAPDAMISGIGQVIGCVATDELRQILNGVHMDIKYNTVTFVATDGHQLATRKENIDPAIEVSGDADYSVTTGAKANIPVKAAKIITSMLSESEKDKLVTVSITNKNITVETEAYTLIYRLLEGNYPAYERVIPNNEHIVEINKSEFIPILRRMTIFSDAISTVVLDINEHGIKVSAEDRSMSMGATETMSVNADFDLRIGLKSSLLINLIGSLQYNELNFMFSDEKHAMLIKPVDNPNITLLQMPILINP